MMEQREKENERHVGFELLRIVSMWMIVFMHAIGHGGLGYSAASTTPAYHIYWLIYAFSRVSTNCFIMLTGYYMVKSHIRVSRIFRVWCEVLFYTVVTYGIAWKTGYADLSLSEVIKVCTPISSGAYWFATGYVILYACIPLLNRVINSIQNKREFQRLLLVMLTLTSLLPTVFYWADPLLINGGYSYIWFLVLYFLAAYIRLYDIKWSFKTFLLLYVVLALTVPSTRMMAETVQQKIGATTLVDNALDYKTPVTVLMSVAFFMLFQNCHIRRPNVKKVILRLAPMSFGVYLLHDSAYIRALLWRLVDMTRFDSLAGSLLYLLGVSAAIVGAGYAVSFVYHKLYRLLPSQKVERYLDQWMKTERKKDE